MIEQSQFLPHSRLLSPIVHQVPSIKKVNVYFTYQSSPVAILQQSLKTIKQQQEEKKKRKIFETKRKLSFNSLEFNKRAKSRLKIFDQHRKRINTLNSHIFLKDSHISGVDTIVDQLQEFQDKQTLLNPINKKLSLIKNRQKTKRTFYSDTVKNSTMFNANNTYGRRNRIQSEVYNYQYSPNFKNRSAVTIKASKQNKSYAQSKISNGLSIRTNEHLFSQFRDQENVQTPKNRKNSYKHYTKSFQPSDFDKKEVQRKKSTQLLDVNYQIDRFYDQSSLETPRLPFVNKKVSYQVTDPLTNSLRKQKLQKKRQKQIEQQKLLVKKLSQNNRVNQFSKILQNHIQTIKSNIVVKCNSTKQNILGFTKSETFFIMIIVFLSLAIFMIQLFQ